MTLRYRNADLAIAPGDYVECEDGTPAGFTGTVAEIQAAGVLVNPDATDKTHSRTQPTLVAADKLLCIYA